MIGFVISRRLVVLKLGPLVNQNNPSWDAPWLDGRKPKDIALKIHASSKGKGGWSHNLGMEMHELGKLTWSKPSP
jgi:hypothetical protein